MLCRAVENAVGHSCGNASLLYFTWTHVQPFARVRTGPESWADGVMESVSLAFYLPLLCLPYLFPSMVARVREHHRTDMVMLINILLGWTIIGWIAALWIAFTPVEGPRIERPAPPPRRPEPEDEGAAEMF